MTVGIWFQFHIQIHRWCFVPKLLRVWELHGPDVSHLNWDQRHEREQHFCDVPGYTSIERERRSTRHFPLRQTRRFQCPHHKFPFLSSNIKLRQRLASLSRNLYDMPGLAPRMDVLIWGDVTFYQASRTGIRQGTLEIVLWSLRSYQTIWSSPLTNVKWHFVMIIYNDNLLLIRRYTKPWPYHRSRPFTEFWEVSIEHWQRVWHADIGLLLLRTPGPLPLVTCVWRSSCWDQSFSRTYYFSGCASNTSQSVLSRFLPLMHILSRYLFAFH